MGNMQAVHVGHEVDPDLQVDTAKSVGDVNPKSTGWITRVRVCWHHWEGQHLVRLGRVHWIKSIRGYAEKLGDEVI